MNLLKVYNFKSVLNELNCHCLTNMPASSRWTIKTLQGRGLRFFTRPCSLCVYQTLHCTTACDKISEDHICCGSCVWWPQLYLRAADESLCSIYINWWTHEQKFCSQPLSPPLWLLPLCKYAREDLGTKTSHFGQIDNIASLLPSPCVPPSKKQSGEQTWISWTCKIARSLIITYPSLYSSKVLLSYSNIFEWVWHEIFWALRHRLH